jgi:hypothetical protein
MSPGKGGDAMCLDCGWDEPDNRHGDKRFLVMRDVTNAAHSNKQSVKRTMRSIQTPKHVADGKVESKARLRRKPRRK